MNGLALEEQCKHEGEHVCEGDDDDGDSAEVEGARGVEAQVEEEDGDFWEGDSGDVEYCGGGKDLFGRGWVKKYCSWCGDLGDYIDLGELRGLITFENSM